MEFDSNFPDEGLVSYDYGGDGKRRTRTHAGQTTYNWDAGFNVLSEENGSGSLTRTYVGRTMAHIDGATPSTGTYAYYTHDHLLSTRGMYDDARIQTAAFEFTPYGNELWKFRDGLLFFGSHAAFNIRELVAKNSSPSLNFQNDSDD